MNSYQIDTVVALTATFVMADGVTPVNPTTVALFVLPPNGVVAEYLGSSITHVSTGNYAFDLYVNASGVWLYKWQGTGTGAVTSADTSFLVIPSQLISG